jgi:hypothetical protein
VYSGPGCLELLVYLSASSGRYQLFDFGQVTEALIVLLSSAWRI